MVEVCYAKIIDVLPSRVSVLIPTGKDETPIMKVLDSSPMVDVIEIRKGNVIKLTFETIPGMSSIKFEPANISDYNE